MKLGTVVAYAPDIGFGIIVAHDNRRRSFSQSDWTDDAKVPETGMQVLFDDSGPLAKNVKPAK